MFGIKALFAGLSRLTAAVNRSAELFEAANTHLEQQFALDAPPAEVPALEHDEDRPARRNGRKVEAK